MHGNEREKRVLNAPISCVEHNCAKSHMLGMPITLYIVSDAYILYCTCNAFGNGRRIIGIPGM